MNSEQGIVSTFAVAMLVVLSAERFKRRGLMRLRRVRLPALRASSTRTRGRVFGRRAGGVGEDGGERVVRRSCSSESASLLAFARAAAEKTRKHVLRLVPEDVARAVRLETSLLRAPN